jgi:hypothetical protein
MSPSRISPRDSRASWKAITTLFVFLYENGKWLEVDMEDLYYFTIKLAESKPEDKNLMVAAITGLVSTNMVDSMPDDRRTR